MYTYSHILCLLWDSEMLTAGYIVVNILAIMLVNGQTQLCMLPTRLPYTDNCMGNRVISTSHLRASTSFRWGAAAHRTILQLHHSTTAPHPYRIFLYSSTAAFSVCKNCTIAPLHCQGIVPLHWCISASQHHYHFRSTSALHRCISSLRQQCSTIT